MPHARSQASSTRKQLEVELAWLARGAKARQSKAVNRIARVEVLKKGAQEVEGRGDLGLASGAARGDAGRRDETRRKRVVVTVDGLGAAYGDDDFHEGDPRKPDGYCGFGGEANCMLYFPCSGSRA